jgi:hypothetical protein
MSFAATAARTARRRIRRDSNSHKELIMSEDFDEIYGSKYLAASDVKKPFATMIEEVDILDFAREGERKKVKAVLMLKGVKKSAVVNKTNAQNLSDEFGKDFEEWIGKRITVKAERTQFGGKQVMGLRLYPEDASTPRAPSKRSSSDDSENPADFGDSPDFP